MPSESLSLASPDDLIVSPGQWQAAREAVVACDLSPWAVLSISGADAATFLQGQLSNDVRRLEPGTWQNTTFNSPKGRVLANFMLWRSQEAYRALVPGSIAEALRKRLSMFVLRSTVAIVDLTASVCRLGLAGPGAKDALRRHFGSAPQTRQALDARGAEVLGLASERFIVVAPEGQSENTCGDVAQAGTRAPYAVWQWLAIRAGEPVITPATQDQFVLQMANLDLLGAVSFEKGCYTGQEIVARTQHLGRLKERLFGFHADGEADAAPATKLYSPLFGDQGCGAVVNSAPAPEGGVDLLAVVQTAAAEGGDVRLGSVEGPQLASFALPYAIPVPTPPRRLA